MFTPDDRWQAFVDAGWVIAQVPTGPRAESTCTEVQYGRALGDVTIGEALAAATQESLPLLRWFAANMLGEMRVELRALLLTMIGRLDPPIAAGIYCWHPGLTDEEDEILKAAFFPTMALMRHKVESGTCPRAKTRG